MTAEEDIIQMLISTVKEFKEGSLRVQRTLMENAVHQTQLYEQILISIDKQTKILENNRNIRFV